VAAIEASLDAGVTFFDTAEGYGHGQSEELLGRVLGARRKDVVIASKLSAKTYDAATVREHCEASIKRLGTDYIDLYQIHWPRANMDVDEALMAMQALVDSGKVRAVGVSNFGKSYLTETVAAGRVESNQLAYSLLWRAIEHEVQPICAAEDISIICYSPLSQGLLTGKFKTPADVPEGRARTRLFSREHPNARHDEPGCEDAVFAALDRVRKICDEVGKPMAHVALAWLLAQDAVTSVIAGARNARQAKENAAASDVELSDDVVAALSEATEPIKEYVGINADMWQSETRMER
jgi:aryl-alcohol dehydrogenase-like predicted oxidoreductase